MSTFATRMSKSGRITVPPEIRERLELRPGDIVLIEDEGDRAVIRRIPSSLEQSFGSIPALSNRDPGDFDDLIEEAMQDHADWVIDRMRRGEE